MGVLSWLFGGNSKGKSPSHSPRAEKTEGARVFDAEGREVDLERPDGLAVPHVFTYSSILRGGWYTYWHGRHDEAMKHSRENALAMRRDPFIMALLRERKEAVLRNKWHLEPDNPKDATQKAVADALTKIIKNIPYLKRLRRQMLERLWYGRYGSELKWVWDVMELPKANYSGPQGQTLGSDGQPAGPAVFLKPQDVTTEKRKILTVRRHRPINGDKIGFHWDGTPYVLVHGGIDLPGAEKIYTTEAPALLLRGWWRKQFLIHTYDPDDADYFEAEMAGGIYGVGIRSRIYWAQWQKLEYFSWIADLFERVGLGIVQIKYDMSSPKAEAEAKETAKNLSRRSVLLCPTSPDGTLTVGGVEVVEAPIQGADMVLRLAQHLERQQERFIIGQSMSGGKDEDNGDGFGGSGFAKFAQETKSDLITADAEEEAEALTGSKDEPGLVSVIQRWTFPGCDFPVRWTPNVREPNPSDKMDVVTSAAALGCEFGEDDVRNLTGLPAPIPGQKTVGGKQAMPMQPAQEAPPFAKDMPGGLMSGKDPANPEDDDERDDDQ